MNEVVVFGGGCFWCTEAIFKMLKGVTSIEPGYSGGSTGSPQAEPPTYEQVSTGTTGHAEVIKIDYDPAVIKFRDLLTVFFASHDPTTPDRQGADVGPQYRSAIFYANAAQKREAENFIAELNKSSKIGAPIITEIKPLNKFYPAEEYHRDFYAKNPGNPYCKVVINPKLQKVQKEFADLLKK